MQCVSNEATRGRYACQCAPGKHGQCSGSTTRTFTFTLRLHCPSGSNLPWPSGHSSLSFSGNSYIQYRLYDLLQEDLKVSLRVRTLQSRGIIMFTQVEPCLVLKVGPAPTG